MFHCSVALLWIFFFQVSSCREVIQHPESLTAHEGDFTIINCTFHSVAKQVAASAKFYRMPDDRNPMNSSSDGRIMVTATDNSLIMSIRNTIICDSGTYICTVNFYYGGLYKGNGTTLNVIASKHATTGTEEKSQAQNIVEFIRISLLLVLISLTFVLLCKFW